MLRKKSRKWRKLWLKRAIEILFRSKKQEFSVNEKLAYFIGTLRIFIPLPSRYTIKMLSEFTYGLKCVYSSDDEKIYKKRDFKFLIPKKYYKNFIDILHEIFYFKKYQYYPVQLKEGDIVVDAGAHFGISSLVFASKVGQLGKVIAIEASEYNYNILQKNILLNEELSNRIISVRAAICNFDGIGNLILTRGSGAHFLDSYIEDKKTKNILNREKVEIYKLDTLFKKLKLSKIDFIKMDIEGAEVDALLGAEEIIKSFKPKLAICSYHRPSDSKMIREIIHKFNRSYEIREIEDEEKVIYAW